MFSLSIDINDCQPSLCQHGGKCIDKVNDFECDCCPGWSGRNCEQCKLDFILNPAECFGPSQVTYKRIKSQYHMSAVYANDWP